MANTKLATTGYVDGKLVQKQDYFADVHDITSGAYEGNREIDFKDSDGNTQGQLIITPYGIKLTYLDYPSDDGDAASKFYVDQIKEGVLSAPQNTGTDCILALDLASETIGISYGSMSIPNSIPQRDENGSFQVWDPINEYDVVPKKYVDDTVASQVSSVYKAKGSVADLSSLPTPDKAHEGFVYNIESEFTTTDLFVEGAGKTYPAGTNVVIVNTTGTEYKYDVLAGMVDLSSYATKTELSGKLDKVSKDHIVYANENTNVQKPITYTSDPTQYTIVYRSANGVTSVGTPTANTHATPKSYVDNADALKMNKSAFDYNDTTKTSTIDIF